MVVLNFMLFSLTDFRNRDLAARVLTALDSASPVLTPAKYGPYKPLRGVYVPGQHDDVITMWLNHECDTDDRPAQSGTICLQAGRPSRAGYVITWSKTPTPPFNCLGVSVDSGFASSPNGLKQVLDLIERLAEVTEAVLVTADPLDLTSSLTTVIDLRLRLPTPGWSMWFGAPYVAMFGRERLTSVPRASIMELPSGHIRMMTTASAFEPIDIEVQKQIIQHLGPECFVELGKSARHYKAGRAPAFDFTEKNR